MRCHCCHAALRCHCCHVYVYLQCLRACPAASNYCCQAPTWADPLGSDLTRLCSCHLGLPILSLHPWGFLLGFWQASGRLVGARRQGGRHEGKGAPMGPHGPPLRCGTCAKRIVLLSCPCLCLCLCLGNHAMSAIAALRLQCIGLHFNSGLLQLWLSFVDWCDILDSS